MSAEKDLLKAYQSKDDDALMEWLMQDSAMKQETKPKLGDAPKVAPVKPGNFFTQATQAAADFILPPVPVENPSTARRVMESGGRALAAVPERFHEGVVQAKEAWAGNEDPTLSGLVTGQQPEPKFKDTEVDLPLVGKTTIPAGAMRAGSGALGVLSAAMPFSSAAGSLAKDAMAAKEELAPSLDDASLAARIEQATESARTMRAAGGLSEPVLMQHDEYVKSLKLLLMKPYDERVKLYQEDAALFAELLSGTVSGYTTAAGVLAKGVRAPAKAANEAAVAARANVIKAAGESIAVREAEKATLKAEEAAKPVAEGTGGPKPPLTLADLKHGMAAESTPGVKAGPSAPGSIPENMMTLEKLSAKQKLGMLQQEPGVQQAIDDVLPSAAEAKKAQQAELAARAAAPSAAREPIGMLDAEAIAKSTNEGGASFALDEARLRQMDEGGYYVGGQAGTVQIVGREVNAQDILDFSKANEAALAKPGAHIGSEKLPDGTVNLDVSIRMDDEAAALKLGGELGEQRIWDAGNGRAIDVPKAIKAEIPDPTITAYHGTATEFDEFTVGRQTRDGGTWFSSDPETAGKRAMTKHEDHIVGENPHVRPVVIRAQNLATEEEFRVARQLMQGDTQMASELMKSKGYDGVVFERAEIGPGKNYLIFDANKSTTPLFGSLGKPLESALEAAERRMGERFQAIKEAFTGERGSVDLRGSFAEGWEKNKMLWNDMVTIGAGRLWEMQSVMANKYAQWSAKMLAAYGEFLKPQLPRIFEASQKRFDDILAKVERQMGKELPALEQALELFHKGEAGLTWYDEAWPQMQRMFGKHAELYVDVLAALSPHNGVKGNITSANKAMALILSGKRSAKKPFKVTTETKAGDGMQAHVDNLNRILKGQPIGGPKVGPFARALKGDKNTVVVDTWMMRAFGFTDKATDSEITFIQQAVTGMAEALGKDARQVQAAIWTGVKIVQEGPGAFVEDIHKTVGRALMDKESPLYAMFGKELEMAKKTLGEEGFTRLGTTIVASRTALFAALGATQGDDAESRARNMLIAAGLGLVASPKLAKHIIERMNDPEVRAMLKDTLKDETGALFPKPRPKRDPLVVAERNAGGTNESRALIRGMNTVLERARMLERSGVQTHEATVQQAALSGRFRTVEDVLALDEATLSLDELAAAKVNVKAVRDLVANDAIETAARAKILDDEAMMGEAVDKTFLLAKVNQKWADMETAGGRFVEASKIKSPTSLASKYDLDEFSADIQQMREALLQRGKVTDRQLVTMLTDFADRAAAAKIADVASRWPEALWDIYYGLNLLGSPITHARNILGNLGALGLAVADRGFGEIISLPFHAAGKGQNMVQLGETWELATGIYSMVADSFRAGKDTKGAFGYARDAFNKGESIFGAGKETEAMRVVGTSVDAGEGTLPTVIDAMAKLGRANLRFMGGTDEFFKVLSFNGEIRALAQRQARAAGKRGQDLVAEANRLIDSPTNEMLQQATAFAKENTFTKQFTPGTLGFKVGEAATHPFMRVAFTPFYNTPMRIAEFSTTHTPVLNLLAKQTWSDMFGKQASGVTRNLAAAKIMTGTAALGLVSWFAINGYITGNAPSDPGLRAAYERSGWKEKSIYNPVNGKYYNYDNLEPISTLLSTAANMVQSSHDLEDWDVQTLMMAGAIATSKSILSKQWFQGLSDMADVIEAATRGEDVAKGLVFVHRRLANLIPGAATSRMFNKMTDDQRREMKTVTDNENPELREWSQLVNIYTQNLPGWGHLLPGTKPRPAMVNMITGEPVANENTWLQALNPFQVTTHKNDPVLNELVALEGAGLPREIPRVIGGSQPGMGYRLSDQDEQRAIKEGVKLDETERQRLGVLLTKEVTDANGNTLHEALAELLDADDWDDQTDGRDGGKAGRIQDVFNMFMDEAQAKLLDEYPKLNQIVQRRQLERGMGKIPKSQEDLKDFAREQLKSQQ